MRGASASHDHAQAVGSDLTTLLGRAGWRLRAGRLARLSLTLAAVLVLALPILGVLDLVFAWPGAVRAALGLALLSSVGIWGGRRGLQILLLGAGDTARHLDRLLGDRRQPVRTAWELLAAGGGSDTTGLRHYLVGETVQHACGLGQSIRPSAVAERPLWRRELRRAGAVVGAVAAGLLLTWPVSRVVIPRVLLPLKDIPPYSHLGLEVTPELARVIYGGSLELSVSVSGGQLSAPMELVTRSGPRLQRAVCFERGGGVFTQRLDDVVQPVFFCFKAGRARTRWRRVEILYQPRITAAVCKLVPPPYAGLPGRERSLREGAIQVLPGTHVRLTVTCNRPVAGGTVQLAAAADEPPRRLTGEPGNLHQIVFEWTARHAAEVSVTVRDVQGASVRKPLVFRQEIRTDEPPVASVLDPRELVLATPSASLPLAVEARDDLGLRRLTLVRTVAGFRDRFHNLPIRPMAKRGEHESNLDLSRLGVAPGDVLEFYAEARDHNPAQTGVAASEAARVQIISEDDYAKMLRLRTSLEEFAARYRDVQAALGRFRLAVEDVAEAHESGQSDDEVRKRLQAARDRARQAAELYEAMIEDFAIYDAENQFRPVLKAAAAGMRRAETMLRNQLEITDYLPLDVALTDLRRLAGPHEAAVKQVARQAEMIAAVGDVMRCAGLFMRIVAQQRRLVRQLEAFTGPTGRKDAGLLGMLGNRQRENAELLQGFRKELQEKMDALPAEYEGLLKSAAAFLARLAELEPGEPMASSAAACGAQRAQDAWEQAREALRRLEQLLDSKDDADSEGFAGMCREELLFRIPKDFNKTMQQLLSAMLAVGQGWGTGNGGAGIRGSGMGGWDQAAGYTGSATPVYGPTRMQTASAAALSGAGTQGTGRGAAGSVAVEVAQEAYEATQRSTTREGMSPRQLVPLRYRDAVRRYFATGPREGDPQHRTGE